MIYRKVGRVRVGHGLGLWELDIAMTTSATVQGPSEEWNTLVDMLHARAESCSERVVFTFLQDGDDAEKHLTYRELHERALAIAGALLERGLAGRPVLLLYPPGLEYIAGLFGCLYAGALAVPAYPPFNARQGIRLRKIAEDAGASVVLSTGAVIDRIRSFASGHRELDVAGLGVASERTAPAFEWIATETLSSGGDRTLSARPLPTGIAFIQYTSGSTAAPKGVVLTHANLMHNLRNIASLFRLRPGSASVSWLPPYHDMGLIGQILEPAYYGVHTFLMSPAAFLQSPMRWLQTISRTRAEVSGGPNFAYELCARKAQPADLHELDLSCWRVAFNGAEPIRAETLDLFASAFAACGFDRRAFYPCYGMAEGTLLLSGGDHQAEPQIASFDSELLRSRRAVVADVNSRQLVGSGRPAPGMRIEVVDPESRAACSEGQIGEIWVSGASVAQGYWQRPELTEAAFKAFIENTGAGPFLRTGDLGFMRDGELFVVGRLKDLIILRGRNLHPEDLELTVAQCHADVRPSCGAAFAVEIEGDERLVIVQEIARHAKDEHLEIANAIRRAIAAEHGAEVHSIALLQVGTIPKTSSGKIQRHACREAYSNGELREVFRWSPASHVAENAAPISALHEATTAEHESNASSAERAKLEQWLLQWVAARTSSDARTINLAEPFAQYGLTSLDVVALSADLQQLLGRKLSPALSYQYPTIRSLAQYLSGEEHRARTTTRRLAESEPIAIVSVACRFPEAPSPEAYWDLLRAGRDAISHKPERWSGASQADARELARIPGGFLDRVDLFDPEFFGISPREAAGMDPQQRLLLEVAWEACERSALFANSEDERRVGVFVGVSTSDYAQLIVQSGGELNAYSGTGTAAAVAANRLSYQLNLCGPSFAIDTACSSSLVAVHLAVQSLRRGECDAALACGVNLLVSANPTLVFSRARMLGPGGRCRTFDASADGYVRGEGCGVVVLKRLSDALRAGDRVIATIRGTAVNQDGRSNGLTAPNGSAQRAVLREALADAGLHSRDIDYVEAHGTGTPLGDPIEVEALKSVLMDGRPTDRACAIGSVKTNIGHLEAAAGMAGLIKAALAIQAGEIPAHLHLRELNRAIDLDGTPFFVPRETVAWPATTEPRRAGVSSFGFGGTNCHVILEQAPERSSPAHDGERRRHLLALSACSETALFQLAKSFETSLRTMADESVADVCFSANAGRLHHDHRLAVMGRSNDELSAALRAAIAGDPTSGTNMAHCADRNPRIVMLFTGQGSQYPDMGRELFETEPLFRDELKRCEQLLGPMLSEPLLSVMYGDKRELLDQTEYTQPALFAIEWSLSKLWRQWGVRPRAVLGHSIGEYVAACVAGVFELEDALELVAARGRLMQRLSRRGGMAAARCGEQVARQAIAAAGDELAIAAVNGARDVVLSGDSDSLARACSALERQGVLVRGLTVSHAFHSPLMDPMLDEFERVAARVRYAAPQLELISNVTGQISGSEVACAAYWRRHVREAVRFWDGLNTLRDAGYRTFLEVGPAPVLSGLGRRDARPEEVWAASLNRQVTDWEMVLDALGKLYVSGAEVSWCDVADGPRRRRVPLPTYPFERRRFWFDVGAKVQVGSDARAATTDHPLLGHTTVDEQGERGLLAAVNVSREAQPYLADHRVRGTAIFPTSGYVELALAAAAQLWGERPFVIQDLMILRPLLLPERTGGRTQLRVTSARSDGSSEFQVSVASAARGVASELYAAGRIAPLVESSSGQGERPRVLLAAMPQALPKAEFYQRLLASGLDYGRCFRAVEELRIADGRALGRVELASELTADGARYQLHPVLLDACFQLLGAATLSLDIRGTYVPVGIRRLNWFSRPMNVTWGRATLRTPGATDGDPAALEGDIELIDDDGRCVASVEGLSLRPANAAQLSALVLAARWNGSERSGHPLLGVALPGAAADPGSHHWEKELDAERLPYAGVYRQSGNAVLPLAAIADLALAATRCVGPDSRWEVTSIDTHRPVLIPERQGRVMQVSLSQTPSSATLRVFTRRADAQLEPEWTHHATAVLKRGKRAASVSAEDAR